MKSFKSGYVAILGQPNVGKSTLMNCFLGQKISIVSSKPGTTRDKIIGVLHHQDGQIIFVDTPGLHRPKTALGDHMVKEVQSSLEGADLILVMIDVQSLFNHWSIQVEPLLKSNTRPALLIINKVDLVSKGKILPIMDQAVKMGLFKEVIPISCKERVQLDTLLNLIFKYLPEGQKYYDESQITDRSKAFLVGETIREKALYYLDEEVPHSVAVKIEETTWKPEKNIWVVQAIIYVEKSSQKAILIGKKGSMLKKIGEESRVDIENQLGTRVYLGLWVKVLKDWKNDERRLQELGY